MANDKVAAIRHPQRAFQYGDWVYATQLPEFDHALGQIDEVRPEHVCPYLVRFRNGERYGAFDWTALEHLDTGEQFKGRLSEELAADYDRRSTPAPRRGFLTPGEIGLGLGIVISIVVLFVFAVAVIKIW